MLPKLRSRFPIGEIAAALALLLALTASVRAEDSSAGGTAVPENCTFAAFGAKGDVVPDDTAAIQAALVSGCPVLDGENRTYRITRTLTLTNAHDLTVANATFLDNVPIEKWGRGVLTLTDSSNIVLKNLRFDRGFEPSLTDGTDNPPNHLRTLFINKSKDIIVEDVEVWGDGAGTAIYFINSTGVQVIRPYVHDMHATARSEHEMLVGIWSVAGENNSIIAPKIRNLYGMPLYLPAESDAISVSGSKNLTISGADIAFVNEGIDISGTVATDGFLIEDSTISDVLNVCYKFGAAKNGRIEDSKAIRCGLAGYTLGGKQPSDVAFIRDTAVNPGSNGWFVLNKSKLIPYIAGFVIGNGTQDPGYPRNVTIEDSQSIDDQAEPTMLTGFLSSADPALGNTIRNSASRGHVKGGIVGFGAEDR